MVPGAAWCCYWFCLDDRPKLIEILDQKRAQNAGLVMARLPVELLVEKMENLDTDNMVDASEEEDSSSAALVPSSGVGLRASGFGFLIYTGNTSVYVV